MILRAVYLIKTKDSFAAIEFLNNSPEDSLGIAKTYSELVRYLYWEERDITSVIQMARAGIQYALIFNDSETRQVAKAIAYNLASYTWSGWGERDIEITASELREGMDAARLNLRLCKKLNLDDVTRARAYWLLGAHLLANGNNKRAKDRFYKAAIFASTAHREAESLMCRAFAALAKDSLDDLTAMKKRLMDVEGGMVYLKQIDTAQRVLDLLSESTETQIEVVEGLQ